MDIRIVNRAPALLLSGAVVWLHDGIIDVVAPDRVKLRRIMEEEMATPGDMDVEGWMTFTLDRYTTRITQHWHARDLARRLDGTLIDTDYPNERHIANHEIRRRAGCGE